jgi:transposase
MRDTDLLQQALALLPPWLVMSSTFSIEGKRLDIHIDFPAGSTFACPVCGALGCKAYDTEEASWRHLNFFQHEAYLHARVPRVNCQICGIRRVTVPWARPGSGFTLLFEAYVMTMVKSMTVSAVARMVKEHDTRLWRIIHHYVEEALARADYSEVTRIGLDETAARRGHDYVTLVMDTVLRRVIFVTPGKDAATLTAFVTDFLAHHGQPEAITEVCQDMSPAFAAGVAAELPNAHITFDKFHVIKLLNEAVDQVRRDEQKDRPELKKTRYLWLKNTTNLTSAQRDQRDTLAALHLKTARAMNIRMAFQDFYAQPAETAEAFLKKWNFWATHSKLQPIIDVARTIRKHRDGILRWFHSGLANGLLEGINSLVQAAKAKARGYRSTRNLIAIIYLIVGKLELRLPT